MYYDENGNIPLLASVVKAETDLATHLEARPYLPMEGLAGFRNAIQNLLFGGKLEAVLNKRVATGANHRRIGRIAHRRGLLKKYFPNSDMYVSDPTWDNHKAILKQPVFHQKPTRTTTRTQAA